jgi:hypothetical protein
VCMKAYSHKFQAPSRFNRAWPAKIKGIQLALSELARLSCTRRPDLLWNGQIFLAVVYASAVLHDFKEAVRLRGAPGP